MNNDEKTKITDEVQHKVVHQGMGKGRIAMIILVVLALVAAVIVAGVLLGRNQESKTKNLKDNVITEGKETEEEQFPTPDDSKEIPSYETWKDTKTGFVIKYPSDWERETEMEKKDVLFCISTDKSAFIVFAVLDISKEDMESAYGGWNEKAVEGIFKTGTRETLI